MRIRVLVVQPDSYSLAHCRSALLRVGLKEREDFACMVGYQAGSIREVFILGQPQLLVTGSISEGERMTRVLVKQLKEFDPKLEVWFFSYLEENNPIYNRCIKKADGNSDYDRLAKEICTFLGK